MLGSDSFCLVHHRVMKGMMEIEKKTRVTNLLNAIESAWKKSPDNKISADIITLSEKDNTKNSILPLRRRSRPSALTKAHPGRKNNTIKAARKVTSEEKLPTKFENRIIDANIIITQSTSLTDFMIVMSKPSRYLKIMKNKSPANVKLKM
jgi:hypothetical protein